MKRNKHTKPKVTSINLKLFLSVLIMLVVSANSFSQTSKGLWMVGGDLGFNNYEGQTSLYLVASGGRLLTNHLGAGVSLDFSSRFSDWADSYGTGLFPYVRYYIGSSRTQPLLLAYAGYGYRYYESKGNFSDFNDSSWDFYWHVGAGVSHFLNKNAAIEGILRYRESFSISFGFQIFFGRTKD